MAESTATPMVALNGAPLADHLLDALASLEIALSIQTAGTATATFEDPRMELFDKGGVDIGDKLTVKLPDDGGKFVEVFTGTVAAIGVENDVGGAAPKAMFVLEARDESHRLAVNSTFTAHLEMKPDDVISAIASTHGLTAKVEAVGAGPEPYMLRAGTDHAVLTELARRYGCEWFTDGKTLHFRPRPAAAPGPKLSRVTDTLVHFSARFTGVRTPAVVKVFGWDPPTAKGTMFDGAVAKLTDGDFGSDAPFVKAQRAKAKKAFGKELQVGGLASRNAKENEVIALSLARELAGSGLEASGVATCNPAIKAGGYVTIEGLGKQLSGSYYVTDVQHNFGAGEPLRTSFSCGGHVVEPAPWHPAGGAGQDWATSGPVIGVVTNNDDPDKLGRVKVNFPSLGAEVESAWARVVSVGAGKDRGIDFRPEVEDEVLVAFERGDPRFPLVLGGLWNGKTKHPQPAAVASGKVNTRSITSSTGQILLFDDENGSVSITLEDNATKFTMLKDKGITLEVPKGQIELKAGGTSLVLKADGDIELKSATKVAVKAKADVAIEAGAKLAAKGAAGAAIDGGPNLEMKSSGMGKLEAGGMLTVKGAMVKIN